MTIPTLKSKKKRRYAHCKSCNSVEETTRADMNWVQRCMFCNSPKVKWYSKNYAFKLAKRGSML